jgi:Tfp pilus assembly major pilin PilA
VGSYQAVEGIKLDVGNDKASPESRVSRGVKVGSLAVQSPLYQEPEIKAGVDALVADTAALQGGMEACAAAISAARKARSELNLLQQRWDRSYDVLLAKGEQRCASEGDGTSLGLDVRPKTSHAFAMPAAVSAKYDPVRGLLRITVTRAPGRCSLSVQVSQDPTDEAAWVELPGDGAVREIKNPAPGTWWVRARSRRARMESDFTTPVSVVVKG